MLKLTCIRLGKMLLTRVISSSYILQPFIGLGIILKTVESIGLGSGLESSGGVNRDWGDVRGGDGK